MDLFNNLHGQVGKTAIAKALTTLCEKGNITIKTYNKQSVYVARQDTLPAPSPEELEAIDVEIEALKGELVAQKETTKQAQLRKMRLPRPHRDRAAIPAKQPH